MWHRRRFDSTLVSKVIGLNKSGLFYPLPWRLFHIPDLSQSAHSTHRRAQFGSGDIIREKLWTLIAGKVILSSFGNISKKVWDTSSLDIGLAIGRKASLRMEPTHGRVQRCGKSWETEVELWRLHDLLSVSHLCESGDPLWCASQFTCLQWEHPKIQSVWERPRCMKLSAVVLKFLCVCQVNMTNLP